MANQQQQNQVRGGQPLTSLVLSVTGFAGRDGEKRFTPGGSEIGSFSLAVNQPVGKDQEGKRIYKAAWFRISAWNGLASVAAAVKKGQRVQVEGVLTFDPETGGPRVWEDKQGNARANFEVMARAINVLADMRQNGAGAPAAGEPEDDGFGGIPF